MLYIFISTIQISISKKYKEQRKNGEFQNSAQRLEREGRDFDRSPELEINCIFVLQFQVASEM